MLGREGLEREMGARIAFVVNALTGPELSGGKSDSARVYGMLTSAWGKCDPHAAQRLSMNAIVKHHLSKNFKA